MKLQVNLKVAVVAALMCVGFQLTTHAQNLNSDSKEIASLSSAGASVRWDVRAAHGGGTLTVAAPDGRVFTRDIKPGGSADFALTDNESLRLHDGQYTYELRLSPILSKGAPEALLAARGKDDEPESIRASRRRAGDNTLVQFGSFSIVNGAAIVPGLIEDGAGRPSERPAPQSRSTGALGANLFKTRQHHLSAAPRPDFVIADDLVVQGSACAGLDCVDGESFGFDTIRVKENNSRIQFDDTSVSAGFATNNWQLRANAQGSGGASFLAIVDQGATGNSETGTIVFEVDGGAPANSLRINNFGRVGLRTAVPALDFHVNSSDTPAIRLEQNNNAGFTPQTWDIGANEAQFFVRDVPGGSLLPFRIRRSAPTSSLDISSNGNVGIGIASPQRKLHVHGTANSVVQLTDNATGETSDDGFQVIQAGANSYLENQEAGTLTLRTSATDRLTITAGGNVGIGTVAPSDLLSVNGNASKPGGGSWAVFSDERLKNIKGKFTSGLQAVMQLQPLRYEYRRDNALGIKSAGEHVGFQAQAVERVIPEAVMKNEQGYLLVNNDPILWTMLNAIKEQQQQIADLKQEVRRLRAASRKRR